METGCAISPVCVQEETNVLVEPALLWQSSRHWHVSDPQLSSLLFCLWLLSKVQSGHLQNLTTQTRQK